jgi:hypothetical protein
MANANDVHRLALGLPDAEEPIAVNSVTPTSG